MAGLTYNTFAGLDNVKIDEWRSVPIYEVDGISHATTEHRFSGTALISATTKAAFETKLTQARALLLRPRGNLVIALDGQNHINITAPDDADGPLGNFRISDPVTPLCAIVTFDVSYSKYELDTGDSMGHVLAHRWTQEWEIGADGMMRHLVAGSLRVLASAAATGTDAVNIGSNPDAYRQIVTPELPPGFRREFMRFAIDETGNRLLYTIEDKEYGRDLPAPATTGRGSFRWIRRLGELGIKIFECELVAPPQVSPRDLLAAAVQVSKRKIVYAGISGVKRDIIQSIEVSEPELFGLNKIGYKVIAMGTSVPSGETGGNLTPPNFELYEDLIASAGLTGYVDLPIYAHNAIRSLRRQLFDPIDVNDADPAGHIAKVPKAGFEQDDAYEITVAVVTAPDAIFDDNDPATFDGGDDVTSLSHVEFPYLEYSSTDRISVQDTGMVLLRSSRIGTPDTPVQLHKPTVLLISEVSVCRLGTPPDRPLRPLPPGAVVIEQDFNVSTGEIDANNQRCYMGYFKRVAQLRQGDSNSTPWFLVPNSGLEQPVTFWPSGDGRFEMPRDSRIVNQSVGGHIFIPTGIHTFQIGDPEGYLA